MCVLICGILSTRALEIFESLAPGYNITLVEWIHEKDYVRLLFKAHPNSELVQDLISILHVFSCRIYGLCKYKKKLEEDEEIAKSIQSGTKANRTTKTED